MTKRDVAQNLLKKQKCFQNIQWTAINTFKLKKCMVTFGDKSIKVAKLILANFRYSSRSSIKALLDQNVSC